jgi:spore maturation protein CgeB
MVRARLPRVVEHRLHCPPQMSSVKRSRWVILGLSITSSWGNGHATTYRGLLSQLGRRGHEVVFLERDVPWYARHRDLMQLPDVSIALYKSLADLQHRFGPTIASADVIIVGSYVPDGRAIGEWVLSRARGVTAFYDIDTPVTLETLEADACEYLSRDQLRRYDLYLSFSGGRALELLAGLGAARPHALYCGVDPLVHRPVPATRAWDLGYLGTYAADRQEALERLLFHAAEKRPARRFIVAGAQYPDDMAWPPNVRHIEHLPPHEHPAFYCSQRFTLNLTRANMRRIGHSPSVRLFEAAACGVPVISDDWPGLSELFVPGEEILVARDAEDAMAYLDMSEVARASLARHARARVLACHTASHRATELESLVAGVRRSATDMDVVAVASVGASARQAS